MFTSVRVVFYGHKLNYFNNFDPVQKSNIYNIIIFILLCNMVNKDV